MNRNPPLSAKEYCYRELKESLISARFLPGEQVTVKSLAVSLGLGIMPVREAVHRLVAEGGLTLLPNRVVRVSMLSRIDFQDVAEIRQLLEPLAVKKACHNATDTDNADILAAWENLAQSIRQKNNETILQANKAFHFSLYQAAHSTHLLRLIELQWLKTGPLLAAPLNPEISSKGRPGNLHFASDSYDVHRTLCDAILAGDKQVAARTIREILKSSAKWYMDWYPFDDSELVLK